MMKKRIKPARMCSMQDIALEKERLRYMALKTELEFSNNFRQTRKLFTFSNLVKHAQSFAANYIQNMVSAWFK